jgi:hypothetical protein
MPENLPKANASKAKLPMVKVFRRELGSRRSTLAILNAAKPDNAR